jgi:subtilisin family serine protease
VLRSYARPLVAAAAALWLAAPAAASISPRLAETLRSAPADKPLALVVTLRDQASISAAPGASRGDRVRQAVSGLRHAADVAQAPVRRALGRLAREGLVGRVEPMWIFDGLAVSATPSAARELAARPEVAAVDLDLADVVPSATGASTVTERNIGLTNAPALWAAGFTGQGVVVASLDTGVDVSHPDLAASWRGGANSWFDPNGEHPATPTDVSGHGTQMMGVIVGGAAGGSAIGMAPGARWIAAKIFNDRGVATASGIHKAFQWVLDPDGNPATADAATVVNNSWSANAPGCDLTYQLDLRNLRAAGILPVFAAGNAGPWSSSSTSPANNPDAFAVGATDVFDQIASFSSRGPSGCGEQQTIFPELVAPGVGVRSADLFRDWVTGSGTSLAAAHVSGALALLASANPNASSDRQASALQSGAVDLGAVGPDNDFGFGRLDVSRALDWLRTAPDFGVSAAPASASTAAGGTAAYTINVSPINGFRGDVALSFSGLDPSQASASLSPSVVAGGNGSATLTVQTAAGLAPGTYPLRVTATAGALTRNAAMSLQVSGPPTFTLDATPPANTVALGGTASYTLAVAAQNGFAGNVTLSVSGLPSGARATFSANPVKGAGSSVMKIVTTGGTRRGTFTLTVSGTSGALVRRVGLTLTVR